MGIGPRGVFFLLAARALSELAFRGRKPHKSALITAHQTQRDARERPASKSHSQSNNTNNEGAAGAAAATQQPRAFSRLLRNYYKYTQPVYLPATATQATVVQAVPVTQATQVAYVAQPVQQVQYVQQPQVAYVQQPAVVQQQRR